MIKLKYKAIKFKDLTIQYSKYRRNRSIRLTVDGKNSIKVTCPYYVSDEELLSFIEERETWIRKTISKYDDTRNLSSLPPLKKSERDTLLLRVKDFVDKYELLLNTKVNNISLRKMKTLWGSCSFREKNICFNSMLYHMSDYFLEYIVLHEIAHLFVHNHSEKFYNLIKKYMPDYKERWKEHKKVSLR